MSYKINSVGVAWIVCPQFHKTGERFTNEREAREYAKALANRLGGEPVEIFECVSNLYVDIPIVEVNKNTPKV